MSAERGHVFCQYQRRVDQPKGYLAWHEWAEKMSKTHRQERCPECGYWHVWVPRDGAE